MSLEESIGVLEHLKKWTKGVDGYDVQDPKKCCEAIDNAIRIFSDLIK